MKTKQIYNYVERLGNLLRIDSRRTGVEYALQPIHLEALNYISICNRYSDTPMAVTEYLGQTKGTVSQTLKVLERKGLLSKQADTNDKRVSHLKVTNLGKILLEESIPSPLFEKACEELNEKSQVEIVASLKTLLQAMQCSNNMKLFGVCHTCKHNQNNHDGSFFCKLTEESLSVEDIKLICREHETIQ